ncbi:NAD(P)/FAD-dependent oxidoreductase [uncultured Aeromicrobium sp.]|uniref:phytoene desaturase family protein n=1 Tax=uncultured Aeromicrobium sp. TaxID=337820 RepID=UPI0025EC519B|nr:NAD(P)/FAD-dependent oxidoreductase [uncultured Aeromicrobium sp.]
MTSAVVVGSGPNGLAAAVTLARRGVFVTVLEAEAEPGGGTRSGELTAPGLLHDHCSAFHPLAVRSPVLEAGAVHWAWAEIEYAHPLDGGRGAAAYRSFDRTVEELGEGGASWRRLFGPVVRDFDHIVSSVLRPLIHVPRHPVALARFGARAALPIAAFAAGLRGPAARALWAGVAAHAFAPFGRPFSSAIGLALAAAAHVDGWPAAVGGSQAIAVAHLAELRALGAHIVTGSPVTALDEVASPDIVLLDTSPATAAALLGSRLPRGTAGAYRRFRHGPGTFKIDFALRGGVPWSYAPARRAGTVHVGGSYEEIAHAERAIVSGVMPRRPFVLVGQQALADPSRRRGELTPVYAYAHVPSGFLGDASEVIVAQIERFAPGFSDRIVAHHVTSTSDLERTNANYRGGDILTGATTVRRLLAGPGSPLHPYDTGVPGVYLCSSATPPGPGAHGACGFHAAMRALHGLRQGRRFTRSPQPRRG